MRQPSPGSGGTLPFALLVLTIEAMKEARLGGLPRFHRVQDLLDDLHADD